MMFYNRVNNNSFSSFSLRRYSPVARVRRGAWGLICEGPRFHLLVSKQCGHNYIALYYLTILLEGESTL